MFDKVMNLATHDVGDDKNTYLKFEVNPSRNKEVIVTYYNFSGNF